MRSDQEACHVLGRVSFSVGVSKCILDSENEISKLSLFGYLVEFALDHWLQLEVLIALVLEQTDNCKHGLVLLCSSGPLHIFICLMIRRIRSVNSCSAEHLIVF